MSGAASSRSGALTESRRSLPLRCSATTADGDVREDHLDLAAEQVVHRRPDAAIGHMQHVEAAGLLLEQLRRDVGDGADAAGAVAELAGVGLQVGDQLLHRLHRQRRIDRDRGRGGGEDRDRRDLLERVIGLVVGAFAQDQRAGRADQQRVAVGGLLRHVVERDRRAAAGAVLDHDIAERATRARSAQMRPMTSCTPPAEVGTIRWIGLLGKDALRARRVTASRWRRGRRPGNRAVASACFHPVLLWRKL